MLHVWLGEDTHAVATEAGMSARIAHTVWSNVLVGGKPGPSAGAQKEDSGRSERKTQLSRKAHRLRDNFLDSMAESRQHRSDQPSFAPCMEEFLVAEEQAFTRTADVES